MTTQPEALRAAQVERKLPQSEGADYFIVFDPKEGTVEFAYTADLGRSFGHDHITDAQEYNNKANRWVVRPVYSAQGEQLTQAARDVLAERARQISAEGWTPAHDDEHHSGSMAFAAAAYAVHFFAGRHVSKLLWAWTGWDMKWWKPKDVRSDLVRAGALVQAEIERIDRAALSATTQKGV